MSTQSSEETIEETKKASLSDNDSAPTVEPDSAPMINEGSAQSADEGSGPADEGLAQAGESSAPAVENSAPAVENSGPADENSGPADEGWKPLVGSPLAADEGWKPLIDEGAAPSGEAWKTLVGEVSAPSSGEVWKALAGTESVQSSGEAWKALAGEVSAPSSGEAWKALAGEESGQPLGDGWKALTRESSAQSVDECPAQIADVNEILSELAAEASSDLPTQIPAEILKEAQELCRGVEVLPDGPVGLARRIHELRKEGRPLRVKFGVDPTSTDLHLGHSVVFRKLRRFQEYGHQVVLIIGGFTAQVGDPSGRDSARKQLTAEDVNKYAQTYIDQLGLVLDLAKTEITNNADWLASMNLDKILMLASKVTANRLLAKEAFGDRLEKQQPVFFHELFYPLLQAYDSVAIKADIELGGTDQRFNILQGRELQPHYDLVPQMVMLLPLLVGTDGQKKMSKSANNYIGLKETPEDIFGKIMRLPDELIVTYFELTTGHSSEEIDKIRQRLEAGENPKHLKQQLAQAIIKQYRGQEEAESALQKWERVHSERLAPEDMPVHALKEAMPLFRVLSTLSLAASGAEAKRLTIEGGVRVDGEQIKDFNFTVRVEPGQSKVLQVGRRKFVKLENPNHS
jgi:tyrosyl-tRNA synthetase